MRAGLIHNPRSQRNRRGVDLRIPPTLPSASPGTPAELLDTLRDFASQGVELLIVSGGDGTLRDVTTLLPQAYGERLPRLSLLAAGNANTVASDVGSAGFGADALQRVLRAAQENRFRRSECRPMLRVSWPDRDVSPVLGFFGGAAVLARATRHANEKVLTQGVTHKASVLVTVAVAVWRAVKGQPGWLGAEAMAITVDDAAPLDGARFLFLVTTLNKLMMGLWPFWGDEDRTAPLRYLDIDSPPRKLWRSLRAVLRGRPTAQILSNGYRSGRAEHIRIHCEEPMVIDGEVFMPGPAAIVEFGRGPTVEFVTP
ncbi:diacylglycerol/lipid kinase family protein [Solimonas terrae]|uniref:DAGKc domain-containing protein n=1 Tax=Solimonas terrae TaxID=1396819 RepID=A0A6M2BN85_9GAMM|nr:diacylglycerol kinase family protein [Solimonas terrae]NGY03635.1 hypothetical protein [Solimonas terrae]